MKIIKVDLSLYKFPKYKARLLKEHTFHEKTLEQTHFLPAPVNSLTGNTFQEFKYVVFDATTDLPIAGASVKVFSVTDETKYDAKCLETGSFADKNIIYHATTDQNGNAFEEFFLKSDLRADNKGHYIVYATFPGYVTNCRYYQLDLTS